VVRRSSKDSKADKVDLAKAAPVKAAPDKGAQVDKASPSSSASRVLAARRDNRVFPDNKAFPSKVARGRKACPVRAGPINSATEARPLVRKADE
jgi:hypothetical protein